MRLSACARLVVVGMSIVLAACDHPSDSTGCYDGFFPGTRVATPSLDISITNRYGRGIANGTTVTAQSAGKPPLNLYYVHDTDTLHAFLGADAAGTFAVTLSKPFYRDTTISNVVVATARCGSVVTTKLPVRLELVAGAPPIRSIAVLGATFFATPGSQARFVSYADADPGVPVAVTWRLSDTLLARIDTNGVVTSRCSVRGGADTVTATVVTAPTVFGRTTFGVGPMASCP